MKKVLVAIISLLVWTRSATAVIVPTVETAQLKMNGKNMPLSSTSLVIPYSQLLFTSSTFDASSTHGFISEWELAAREPDSILIRYSQAVAVNIAGHEIRIREFLLPLPRGKWPSYFYGRLDEKVYAFSKFLPQRLADVACSAEVGLKEVAPYSSVCKSWQPSPL